MTPQRLAKLIATLDRRQPDLTVLMEDTRKTHNIAAILRTAEAVGVFKAHAVSADQLIPRHHMTSAGSRKWMGLQMHSHITEAITALKAGGHHIVAAHRSEQAIDYRAFDYTQPCAVLLGSELPGVSDDALHLADTLVQIPIEGMVESLNVSVAAALILFEARRQREAAGIYQLPSRLPPEVYRTTLFEWAYPDIARRCRVRKLPYPALLEDGQLSQNPFADEADGD